MKFLLIALALAANINSKMIEVAEDNYLAQAPDYITQEVQRAVELFNFDQNYEVVIPKKAGIQINPWCKIIASGINPLTKNTAVIINPQYFNQLESQERFALICNAILTAKHGLTSKFLTALNYIMLIISIAIYFLIFALLGHFQFLANQRSYKILLSVALGLAFNYIILPPIHQKLRCYLNFRHAHNLNLMVIEKTKNKDALIKALLSIDEFVNKEFNEGEEMFRPYTNTYKKLVNALKEDCSQK